VPTKKVTLELEFDSDFESSTYAAVGDLLQFIEDSDFTIKGVNVENAYVLKLDSLPIGGIAKTTNKRKRWLDDYSGQ